MTQLELPLHPTCFGTYTNGQDAAERGCFDCPECSDCISDTKTTPPSQRFDEFDEARIDVIGQNGNTGAHYDPVTRPQHYQGRVECIDVIESALADHTAYLAYMRGNALKYLFRAGKKGDVLEDLKKAGWYLNRCISELEKK